MGDAERQKKSHSRSLPELAVDLQKPIVGLDDMLDDGEAEPCASEFARAGFVDAIKTLGEARQVFCGNATAGVGHHNLYPVSRGLRIEKREL
jgi:hypothetical protein